jgi:glucose/arabinose dehydrogenase
LQTIRRTAGWIAISLTIGAVIWNETGEAARAAQQSGGSALGAKPVGGPPQLDTLKLPKGFSVAIYAENVTGARSMALAPDGTIFVGTQRQGVVYAVIDRNRDNRADGVVTVARGLNTPNGVAIRDGALYVAELNRVLRYDGALDALKAATPGGSLTLKPTVINDKFPSDRLHGWKYLEFGPDGMLYVQVGAPCNICERPDPYASILRMKPDGSGLEVFARGVRNTVGLAFHPDTRELWFTDNGRDMLGDEQPNDELNHAARAGLHFGYPYCHEGAIADPELGKTRRCAEFTPPAQKLGPHVAALGLTFYTGTMFPAEYRKQLFIVNHGSWNRTPAAGHTGYRVMLARIQGDKVVSYEPFITGWLLPDNRAWGRPVDVLVAPDGALLISDDRANLIYRVSYKG